MGRSILPGWSRTSHLSCPCRALGRVCVSPWPQLAVCWLLSMPVERPGLTPLHITKKIRLDMAWLWSTVVQLFNSGSKLIQNSLCRKNLPQMGCFMFVFCVAKSEVNTTYGSPTVKWAGIKSSQFESKPDGHRFTALVIKHGKLETRWNTP